MVNRHSQGQTGLNQACREPAQRRPLQSSVCRVSAVFCFVFFVVVVVVVLSHFAPLFCIKNLVNWISAVESCYKQTSAVAHSVPVSHKAEILQYFNKQHLV